MSNSVIKAGEEITFLPGFEVKTRAEFHAYVENSQHVTCADDLAEVIARAIRAL